MDVLTRCKVVKDETAKKTISIIPIKEPGEPAVISIQISQAKSSLCCHFEISLCNLLLTLCALLLSLHRIPKKCFELKSICVI